MFGLRHFLQMIVSCVHRTNGSYCNVVRARGESNLMLVHTCMIAIIIHYLITNSVCACCYCALVGVVVWVEKEYDVEIALVSKYGSPSFLWWHIIKLILLFISWSALIKMTFDIILGVQFFTPALMMGLILLMRGWSSRNFTSIGN